MVAREQLVAAGLDLAEAAFLELCPAANIQRLALDGQHVPAGFTLLKITAAPARGVLSAERVALNFAQRLSGVATLTAQYVEAVSGTLTHILDTRKTTPGWRRLEKYAVVCGGGMNHRFGLFDRILIKDNHLAALGHERPSRDQGFLAHRMVGRQGDRILTRGDSHLWDDPPFGEDEVLGEVVSILRNGRPVALTPAWWHPVFSWTLRHSELCTRIVLRLRRSINLSWAG